MQRAMGRVLFLVATAALLTAGIAEARPVARSGGWDKALRTLERGTRRLARTRVGDRSITAVSGHRFSVYVDPSRQVISVSHPRGITGYRLGRDGTLAAHDRLALTRLLGSLGEAPGGRQLVRGLFQGARVQAQRVDAERGMDAQIGQLLARAQKITGSKSVTLWQGRKGSIEYRPDVKVLGGITTWSRTGIFLRADAKGRLQPAGQSDLTTLRSFLLDKR